MVLSSESFKMWKTTNGGTNWTLYTPTAPNSAGAQNSVFMIDGNFYGFGLNTASARVAITTNGGTTFNYYPLSGAGGANGFVSTVAFSNDKINGLCGTDQTSTTIPRTTNGGLNWFAQTIPCTITGMCSIKWVPGTATAYVVVSNSSASQCFKSEDNGNTWVSYSFPSGTVSITHSNLVWYNILNGPNAAPAYVFAISSAGTTFQLQDSPMPVKLQSFTYNVNGRNAELKWTTSEEINNYGFEIYRLRDGLNQDNLNNWQKAGFINGNGTKNTPTNYSFSDLNLTTGKYVYRLKQIDYNGNYEYFMLSGKVDIGSPLKYNLAQNYPNPFNPVTKIDYTLPYNSKVTLKVYDLSGREIVNLVNTNQTAGYYSVNFDAGKLSSGAYFYKFIATSEGKENIVLTKLMNVIK